MIFELISWFYISLVCLIWGSRILKVFFHVNDLSKIELPVICFLGLAAIGILTFFISLFSPLSMIVRLIFQISPFLLLIQKQYRDELYSIVIKYANCIAGWNRCLLLLLICMNLLLTTATVIHPDTLNYHAFSTILFNRFSIIPGIANLKPEFGFQSSWFAMLAFFEFPFTREVLWYPLNGCVVNWVMIFLIHKGFKRGVVERGVVENHTGQLPTGFWRLVLLGFSVLSWTQIRLTASSLSPDYIAAICILLAFYFFSRNENLEEYDRSDLLAVLFAAIAVSVKLSALPVLLIPAYLIAKGLIKSRFIYSRKICMLTVFILTPGIIRSIISSGYPFYPSAINPIRSADWLVDEHQLTTFQHYITSYARFPMLKANADALYQMPISGWIPIWWSHLYLTDKIMLLVVLLGGLLNLIFIRKLLNSRPGRLRMAFYISISGVLFWFVNAPDPRFGTGFLLPLIYFEYVPFLNNAKRDAFHVLSNVYYGLLKTTTMLTLLYIGYRSVRFFTIRQIVVPQGFVKTFPVKKDCDAVIKQMILSNSAQLMQPGDSCLFFHFRGSTVQKGFKPLR